MATNAETIDGRRADADFDVAIVGAGFAGLYLLHRLRGMGYTATIFESADDVGGTWYWNRYPGARCDIQSIDYSYSFDAELEAQWQWSEKYATQPEILRYIQHVADRFDLRRDIRFSTRIDAATWDDEAAVWQLRTGQGDTVRCRYYVMATGCLSAPKTLDITGAERFLGDTYSTSRWPHDGVDFSGLRVAVVGTGSSGIQSIPLIAEQAAELTVFQRTANFSIPARNGPIPATKRAAYDGRREAFREEARWTLGGVTAPVSEEGAMQVSAEERLARYERIWEEGDLIHAVTVFNDMLANPESNATLADFIRDKIRKTVDDPEVADALCPQDFPVGTKRLCLDSHYYETFNQPHVRLVNLRRTPIRTITEKGIDTSDESFEFDAIVFATGFDAMTGALVAVDIAGREGLKLADKWADGPRTYLGLMTAGFPNLFMITGPGSPSVLSNMMVSIEQHVEWICDTLDHLRRSHLEVIEPTLAAEAGWVRYVNDFGDITLFPQANSWYMGANVPGKPRVFLPYVGGVDVYRTICNEVVDKDFLGFRRSGPEGTRVNDGVVRPVQPDVTILMEIIDGLDNPPLNEMTVEEARAFAEALAAERPPGPEVGEIVDGRLEGADGELEYRLYRPASPGPHPVVVYFHGGGWVLGGKDSDDPLCRELCAQSDLIVVSCDYRHAPEHRFPAAAEDGYAAVKWVADNAAALGGIPGRLAVAGWSAGGNIAAVACQLARDCGGPEINAQLLITPVIDADFSRNSYVDNADDYVLTAEIMRWFWDHYADPADRQDPMASPLRADSLADLPPALIVTCEFDPLRDEGLAYADALMAAGVPVRHMPCRGQIHTSITAVDMVVSSAAARAEMANWLRDGFGASAAA